MSFLARNEYLLREIDYYHGQISSRLTTDEWSENYREIWNAVCLQLNWHEYAAADGPKDKLARRLLGYTRYGKLWSFDSPILSGGNLALLKEEPIAYRTLFGYEVFTTATDSWQPFALGMLDLGNTLALLRLIPYVENYIEVEAGDGYYAFLAAQHEAMVTAFEPAQSKYARFNAGMERNGFENLVAPQCSVRQMATGESVFIEDETERPLALVDYRAAGTFIKLVAHESGLLLLRTAGDWLSGYDAPIVMFEFDSETSGNGNDHGLGVFAELEGCDYSIFPIANSPRHEESPLLPPGGASRGKVSYVGLPPMAKDLADILSRPVDMRLFTSSAKLENLYYFVRCSFEAF